MTSFERWRSLLHKGCVAAVIKELQELHASGRYREKQCYDLQGEINYFTTEPFAKFPRQRELETGQAGRG